MTARDQDVDTKVSAARLLTAGAEAEQQLLGRERKAEKRLADAMTSLVRDEAHLRRAQERLGRSRQSVAAAAETLREVQDRRADGPRWAQD